MNEITKDRHMRNAEYEKNKDMPPKPKRGRGGLILVIVLVLIFGAFAYWRIVMPKAQLEALPQQAVQVYATEAQLGSISVNTTLTGKVRAAEEASIFAAGGEVKSINVAVGDYVEKGQRLFSLDGTQVQGGVAQAQAARDMAQVGVDTARQNLERMQVLYDSSAISIAQLEQAQTALSTAQSQLRQAQAGLSSASSSLSLLNFDSPINGYITEVNIKEGMYPAQTQPSVAIADLDELEISASVSEYLIGFIREGSPANFKITSLGDTAYEGTIKTVALAPAVGSLTYPITVTINAPKEAGIMPGMFAEISLPANNKEQALIIPAQALMTQGGQTLVAVLEEDIPSLRVIKIGLNNGETVEVIEGLEAGETVITKGQHFIVEGEAVVRLTD